MLTFVGLGLYDEQSITVEGQAALRSADRAYAEFYTSTLVGASVAELEAYHDVEIAVRDRAGVEQSPEDMLKAATNESVVFLTAGDPMVSTTHVDLRLRAADRGIDTRIVHGTTAQSAASGLTGLQNYRFGKATTLPFPDSHGGDAVPKSVIETITGNQERGLHTLVYLDIKAERESYMTASEAAELLAADFEDTLGVAVARAGSPDPVVRADRLSGLAGMSFGDPLHLLVLPGTLHHIEADALETFGDAPSELLTVE